MEQDYYAEYREIEDWHWWFQGRRKILFRLLDRHPGPADASRRVLDIGCGTGAMLQPLSRYGTVDGVDADPNAVRFCRERGVEGVRRLSSETLPWEPEVFDLVTALDVIEHIDDDRAFLEETHRVLRPRGTLLLTVPAYELLWGPQDEISHHKRRYRAGELRERVEGVGLRLARLSYFNTLLFPAIAAVRLLRPRRAPDRELRSDFALTGPGRLNEILARVFASEAALVERWRLPFGVSIVALARKGPHGP
ncbi:MAG: class I SAM-dependent methyltransferase [Actinomycetota bacterium]|nr:class I SAM-dependent methyltransferase [Actinomycetota bacterium]